MGTLKALVLTFERTGEMRSQIPKALHKILGKSMLNICADTLKDLGVAEVIILGGVCESLDGVVFTGSTGKSVNITDGLNYITAEDTVIVMDVAMPLITKEVLREFLETHVKSDSFMTVANSYRGYGAGFYCFSGDILRKALKCISEDFPDNKYELQSLSTAARSMGITPKEYISDSRYAFLKVKNRADLAHATGILKEKINIRHMLQGVTIVDPSNTYIGPDVIIGEDTTIYPGCTLEGATSIGHSCEIGHNTKLSDVVVGDHTNISSSVACKSEIGSYCEVGPFAYIRPGCKIGDHIIIGNFVDMKNDDVPSKVLGIARTRRVNKPNWRKPRNG